MCSVVKGFISPLYVMSAAMPVLHQLSCLAFFPDVYICSPKLLYLVEGSLSFTVELKGATGRCL